ncbi:glycerophosphodiester phosphodiesterase [soil metagenome]
MTAPAWLTAKPFAHRGLHGEGTPENSLAAIETALAAGYPAEIDVRLSADGRVIVFHDDDLARMTGVREPLAALPASRLTNLSLNETDEKIPLLQDVLDLAKGREGLLIEIKSTESRGRLEAETARLLRSYQGEFAVQSFHPRSLTWFRKYAPDITRGQLSSGWHDARSILSGNYLQNWLSRPHFLGHDHKRLPAAAVALFRRFGCPILAWTVRSPEERDAALQHADNIIFEQFRP